MSTILHEFAVDPTAIGSFENFRAVVDACGIPHGRLIAEFPKGKWKRMMYDNLKVSFRQQQVMEIRLSQLDSLLINRGRKYDGSQPWVVNAATSHADQPFAGIVCAGETAKKGGYIDADILMGSTPGWQIARDDNIPKLAADLAAAAEPLLIQAKEVVFVDPYFDPTDADKTEPLLAFLEKAAMGKPIRRVEVHSSADQNPVGCSFSQGLELFWGASKFPIRNEIIFARWQGFETGGERPHPRYVLTEHGGIRYDYGLDARRDGGRTDIGTIDTGLHAQRLIDYSASGTVHNLVEAWILDDAGVAEAKATTKNANATGEEATAKEFKRR